MIDATGPYDTYNCYFEFKFINDGLGVRYNCFSTAERLAEQKRLMKMEGANDRLVKITHTQAYVANVKAFLDSKTDIGDYSEGMLNL